MYEFTIASFLEFLKVRGIKLAELQKKGIGREIIMPRWVKGQKNLTSSSKKRVHRATVNHLHRVLNELGVNCSNHELHFAFMNDNFTFLIETFDL